MKDISLFEEGIGIKFKNKDLLTQALTHRSYLNENPGFKDHNERLEFLGDAVLELVVTEYLFVNYDKPEGDLTNWRAALVNSKMLAIIAKELDIDHYLLLSHGEERDTGRAREFILANAFEALLGTIYLDKGVDEAKDFIQKHVLSKLPMILKGKLYQDPKSVFQEKAQEKLGITPHYEVLEEWGPDHRKQFKVGVYLGKDFVAEAEGISKHTAEKEAAGKALKVKKW